MLRFIPKHALSWSTTSLLYEQYSGCPRFPSSHPKESISRYLAQSARLNCMGIFVMAVKSAYALSIKDLEGEKLNSR